MEKLKPFFKDKVTINGTKINMKQKVVKILWMILFIFGIYSIYFCYLIK